ncbi:cell division protein ZipA C-terminal FtsZ-binding domain-containing protein [soil metagenome]
MSSNLFYYLAGLGVLVLAALVVHGAWKARMASPRRAEVVQTDAARELREPTMDGAVPVDAGGAASEGLPIGDSGFVADREGSEDVVRTSGEPLSAADEADAAAEPWLVPRRSSARIDALVDAIAVLTLEAPISGEMAIAHLPPSRRAGGKPFLVEGLNADSGLWEPPMAMQRYGEFQAGVLLANRTGALNEIEYSEFVQKVQGFADGLGALPQFPDMLDAVAHARELDTFASQHDAQLAVRLQASVVAWSVGYIHQQAARHGFVAGAVPGRLVYPGAEEGAPPVLVLNFDPQAALAEDPNQAAVRDMTLSFDVPQTEAASNPFASWQKAAQGLATDTEASLVDDNGNPIGNEGFEAIGAELGNLYDALEARGLPAGSMATRRLFS